MSRPPYPLQWPAGRVRNKYPDPARTSVTLDSARDHLLRQLTFINAKLAVITSNAKLRTDGLPLAKQPRLTDTGVAVWFKLPGNETQYCICCDQCEELAGNVRAVGLAIDELRGAAARLWIPLPAFFTPFVVNPPKAVPTPPAPLWPKPDMPMASPEPKVREPKIPALGPYSVLGIPNTSPYSEVCSAYKRLSLEAKDAETENRIHDAFQTIKQKRGFK